MIYGQPITLGGKKAEGEIAITANGTYDVAEYATANVNVAPVLLWTNASPDSYFNAQTIVVNTSGYNAFLIECRGEVGGNFYQSTLIVRTSAQQSISAIANDLSSYGGAISSGVRHVKLTGNNFVFSNGLRITGLPSLASSSHANYAIPTRIWGVKFTL